MEELEQNLENLDELRKQAKDYANTLVLPNDDRLEKEEENNKQEELLAKRDAQETKWKEEVQKMPNYEKEGIYLHSQERIPNLYSVIDIQKELLELREKQEEEWKKPIFAPLKKAFLGVINGTAKKKLTSKEYVSFEEYFEEVARTAENADKILEEQQEPIKIVEEQNELLENIPNEVKEQVTDELFQIEKQQEEIQMKTLGRNKGSAFSSILLIVTTLTVGIIAAVMILK